MFRATRDEHASGAFGPKKLAAIIEAVHNTGYAVVDNLVSPESCELLMTALLEDVERVRALDGPTRHEQATGLGHLQLGLRRYAPFVRSDVVANPLIEHIVSAILGRGAWLGFYNGNVNLPGSVHQPLHFDRPFSWRSQQEAERDGQPWPPPPTTLSCSMALTEITKDNGATEIYPGTHKETAVIKWPAGERVSQHPDLVAQWGPPARMPIPSGGICFRDPRMWHRGVPNTSNQVRPMIALTYHSGRCLSWRGRLLHKLPQDQVEQCRTDPYLKVLDDRTLGDGRLVFESSAQLALSEPPSRHGVDRNARFVAPPQRVNHFVDAHLVGGARVVGDHVIGPE